MEKAIARVKKIKMGNPLDPSTMIGAQASSDQKEKILSYIDIGRGEGAKVLTGGKAADLGHPFNSGFYIEPTVLEGHNKMRVFQEEIFGPVLAVTKFKDEADALAIANDTIFGLGAGVWTRDGATAYRMGRGIQAGRVWTNCYHLYPAHAAFGGYKQSGIGRENAQDDARSLPADQEPAGQLQPQGPRLLLILGDFPDSRSSKPAPSDLGSSLSRRLRNVHIFAKIKTPIKARHIYELLVL